MVVSTEVRFRDGWSIIAALYQLFKRFHNLPVGGIDVDLNDMMMMMMIQRGKTGEGRCPRANSWGRQRTKSYTTHTLRPTPHCSA